MSQYFPYSIHSVYIYIPKPAVFQLSRAREQSQSSEMPFELVVLHLACSFLTSHETELHCFWTPSSWETSSSEHCSICALTEQGADFPGQLFSPEQVDTSKSTKIPSQSICYMLLINIDQNLPEMISTVEWVILPQCTLRYHAYLKVPKPEQR